MPEVLNNPEEHKRPIWKELVDAELEIAAINSNKKIDSSGPSFLGAEELIRQIKAKYNWNEKWTQMSPLERANWAAEYKNHADKQTNQGTQKIKQISYYFDLAESYAKQAESEINAKLKTDSYLSSFEENFFSEILEELTALNSEALKIGKDDKQLKDLARKYLKAARNFLKSPIFKRLNIETQNQFKGKFEIIESDIDDADVINMCIKEIISFQINLLIKNKPL